jgi:hypothetical protein
VIAALYVEADGCYFNLPNVDPWPVERDARLYDGPCPVVAHPPCQRWGRYWSGGPSARVRREKGDDGGCFAAALSAVRRFRGVLEHPEASHAWRAFGLNAPPRHGGWVSADFVGGWTCCVEQGHYGHRARKATWLYAFGVELPVLKWGPSAARVRLDSGFHSKEERMLATGEPVHHLRATSEKRMKERGSLPVPRLHRWECAATPLPFRDLLISIAESAKRKAA